MSDQGLSRARNGVAAVVAPFSAGAFYVAEFARRGWPCVAVVEPDDVTPPLYRGALRASAFEAVVVHTGDVAATAARLRELGVSAVVAGTEIGVPLGDVLSAALDLPGNDPDHSDSRRDKGAMVEALRAAGVPAIPTLRTSRLTDALDWAHDIGTRGYVVKPADSAGSDGVAFCRSRAELAAAWHAIHGRANAMGGSNNTLVVQQQVHGMQYIVNTVSAGGQHMIAEIWADHRIQTPDGHGVYDRTEWLSPDEDPALFALLASYVRRAITAVGVRFGPAHSEVMLTETGPILIETGVRPEGPVNPDAVTLAVGTHHVRAAVDAVVAGRVVPELEPRTLRHACRVTLCAPYDGTVDSAGWAKVLDLPAVAGTLGHVTGGSPVRTTVDLLTSPDSIYLVGDRDVIEDSYRTIRELERNGSLYQPVNS